MDIEGVLGLIVLALYVWSLIRKKKKKERVAAASAPKPGLLSQVTDKIKLFVRELEKRAAEAQKVEGAARDDSSLWDRLSGDRQPRPWEREEVVDEEDAPLEWELASLEAEDEPLPPIEVPLPPVVSKPVAVKDQALPRPGALAFSPDTLRNAVVWSEILSPPLALRKDGRQDL